MARHPADMKRHRTDRALGPRSAPAPRRRIALRSCAPGMALAMVLAALSPAAATAEADPGAIRVVLPGSTSLSGNYLAARRAGAARDMAAGAVFYKEALADDPDNAQLIERAFTLALASGDITAASQLAGRLPPRADTNRLAGLAQAVIDLERGDPAAARTVVSEHARGPLADLTAALVGAWTYAAEGDRSAALNRLDTLRGPDLYTAFTTFHGGIIADFMGDHAEARRRLAIAYDNEPSMLRIVDAYARALARDGAAQEAAGVLDRYTITVGTHPIITTLKAEIAAGTTPPPLVQNPKAGVAEALFALGTAISREGSEEIAAAYLQLALLLEPNSGLAAMALAGLHERLDQSSEAVAILEKIPPSSPLSRDARTQLGLNLNALERADEARVVLEALVKEDPSDLEAVVALGGVLRSRDLFAEAAAAYTLGIDSVQTPDRRHWTLYYQRGISYERSKQWDKAEADFQRALELYPDHPLVLNYLGYSWIDMGRNLEQALEMVQKAVDLRPTDGYIIDSLGWAYFRLGRYEEAVAELERAVEMMPNDAVINDHLGDAYWMVGRRLEARFQWSHARDSKPDPAELEKILAKLEKGLPAPTPATAADAGGQPEPSGAPN
jgi:tetratricopeptide (TPR) repeat protein